MSTCPSLGIGDRIGELEVVDTAQGYHEYRVADIELSYDGPNATEINVFEDSGRKYLIGSYPVVPGDYFSIDVGHLDVNRVYLAIGQNHAAIKLTGNKAVAVGDIILDCPVFEVFYEPLVPPHYFDLTLEYVGAKDPFFLTACDGNWQDVIGTYEVDSAIGRVFSIDGSSLPKGHLEDNLVLEYGPVE